jgi:hypothetical protein
MAKKMDIKKVWTRGEAEGFTAYMVATIVNVELGNRGLEEIRPQMMYNYDRNGLINGTKGQNGQERNGKFGYTTPEVIAFANKFADMREAKGRKAPVPPAPSAFSIEDVETAAQYVAETVPTLDIEISA